MTDHLFTLLEQPFIWLSHRLAARSAQQTGKSRKALGRDLDTDDEVSFGAGDLARHTYILGSTGCGKTSLILRLIERDIRGCHTVCVVDLRGDLVTGVLGICHRMGVVPARVSLLDLRERVRIQGFNPLAGAGEPYIRALHVLDVVAAEAESWGVQLEETLRSALLLLALSGRSLADLERLFYESRFLSDCLRSCSDEALVAFWGRYADLSPEKQHAWAMPVLNKVTALLAVPTLRAILGSATGLDLGALLSEPGRIILVSLAVDELHRSSRMLGSLIVSAISREMMARVNVPESDRNPARLYVDEFENMASESFEGLIAEGRRFGLTLVLSHQTLSQLAPRLRSVVRNNVGLQILFQCGFEDARQLRHELPDDVSITDLRLLTVGQAVVMKRDGSAQAVQFRAPAKASGTTHITEYRNRVLGRLPLIQAVTFPHATAVQSSPGPSLDLDGLL